MAQEHNPVPGDVKSITRSPEMQEKALRRQVLARGFRPWECPENLGLTRKGIAVVCMSVAAHGLRPTRPDFSSALRFGSIFCVLVLLAEIPPTGRLGRASA